MSKATGSWSAVRKALEQDLLCEALRGRVRYRCTKYPNTDNQGIFEIFVDGKPVKNFSMESVGREARALYGGKGRADFWTNMRSHMEDNDRAEFDDQEFAEALRIYRQSDIQSAVRHENPVVRMFAVLDRRLGRRSLERLREETENQPDWLRAFCRLRLEAEGIQ
ncbi:MAG: hypothetical protein IJH52_07450 [Oscillospiraceae bacterium]|nr:hypothetical protein [Oscillospiraceae bacterium]